MSSATTIALVAVTRRGVEQARLLRRRLRAGEVHRPERYGPPEHGWEVPFAGPLSERVPELFQRCGQMVFFLASGAVTRLIAPCLVSKQSDPGVLAVDEAGRFVIPLLSGHKGGANAFARTVAGCLGATPVITTASDVLGGLSLDLLEDAFGWTASPRERLKPAARALVDGEALAIVQEVGSAGCWLDEMELPANVTVVRDAAKLANRSFACILWITDRSVAGTFRVPDDEERVLWYRPKSLVLGVGCERGISAAALEDGLGRFLGEHGFARDSIGTLTSIELKADEQGLVELASRHGWETCFYAAEELAAVAEMPNPSAMVARCVGTPGVAEPAALLAAGADRLLVEKQVVSSTLAPQRMTFALARLASYQTSEVGGKVVFVGAGPGDPDLLTLKGRRALAQADVVVYAGSLVAEEVLRHAPATAILHNSAPLTLEEVLDRLTAAVRAGKRVVRLHSGDTSLYSAIQEQMTRLDEAGIGYDIIPGISSFQAAAAALKAELTLPEVVQTVILTRAEGQTPMPEKEALADLARHQATLCIFLSARLVEQVQEQLLAAYPPDTPTAILYHVSWPDEQIIVTELRHLVDEVRRHQLTRTTLILVERRSLAGKIGRGFTIETTDIFSGRAVMKKRILLLSGTSEGPPLARALLSAGFEVRATVTRAEARATLFGPLLRDVQVEVRGFTEESMTAFLAQRQADLVLDATHPFAVRITRLAHAVCLRLGVPYVRYERPDWEPPPGTRLVDSFTEAAALLPSLVGQAFQPDGQKSEAGKPDLQPRVLLTIGAKQLKHFAALHSGVRLFARILPSVLSIQQALAAGFTPDRLLCLRPPFSREFNRAILQEYRIGVLVTKASGREGGVEEKVLAAGDLGVEVIMIRRPESAAVTGVCSLEAAVQACRDI